MSALPQCLEGLGSARVVAHSPLAISAFVGMADEMGFEARVSFEDHLAKRAFMRPGDGKEYIISFFYSSSELVVYFFIYPKRGESRLTCCRYARDGQGAHLVVVL